MEKFLLQDSPVEDRPAILRDSCDKIEKFSYIRPFEEGELQDMKEKFSSNSVELASLTERLNEQKEKFKGLMKPLQESNKVLIANIRQKGEIINDDCFVIVSEKTGEVGYYNGAGELVYTRPILPSERQTTIMSVMRKQQEKEGTND